MPIRGAAEAAPESSYLQGPGAMVGICQGPTGVTSVLAGYTD